MNFKELLKEAIENNTKIIVTGRSGWGKSEMIQQVAEELNLELIDFRLSEVLPEDIVGIPKVKGDYYEYVPPVWLYDVITHPDKKYLLFLDEITQGTPEVLNICYKIFDKVTKVGNHTLNNVAVVGATNYSSESNYLSELPQPLKNRACMIELPHNSQAASSYLMDKYKLEDKSNLNRILRATIEEYNPRSTEKAIQLILNKCSKELCIPFVGLANYQNIASVLDVSVRPKGLTSLEEALYDIKQGYINYEGKSYVIDNSDDLKILYNLTDEEADSVAYELATSYKPLEKATHGFLTQYALSKPELSASEFELISKCSSFNPIAYLKKMKLNATTMTNQFESLVNIYNTDDKGLLRILCEQRIVPLEVMKIYRNIMPWDIVLGWAKRGDLTPAKAKEFATELATERAKELKNDTN